MSLFVQVMLQWIEFVSLASSTGVLVCLLWVLPPSQGPSGRRSLLEGMRKLLGIGIAVMIATSILGLLVRAAEMSGRSILDVAPVLPTVVLRTHGGTVWIIRMVALVLLAVTMMAARRYRHSRLLQSLMLGFAIVMCATESASGHASNAGDFSVAEVMDWLHLLGPMVWGGGLLVLSVAVLPRFVQEGDRAAGAIAGVATRFSRIAGVAVAFIAVTALYQAWNYAGSVEALAGTPYGLTIIVKIVLFALLLCLGAFNRYVSVPRLQQWAGSANTRRWMLGRLVAPVLLPLDQEARGPLVARRFTWSVKLETYFVLAVLLCSALLRHEVPARHARHLEHEAPAMQMHP